MTRTQCSPPARFSREPLEKSSRTTTSCFDVTRCSTRWEPMKPAPPVTRYRMFLLRRARRVGKHAVSDRKSTRLNSSHVAISYAVFCLKKNTDTPLHFLFLTLRRPPRSPLFPYTTLFRSFSREPLEKSSRTTTSCFDVTRCSTRWEPMKPAPPVTRYRMFLLRRARRVGKHAV